MRRRRGFVQFHVGLFRSPAGFAAVARGAGADDILPGVLPAAVARDDMVEGELFSLFAAVLAGELVAVVNLGAADFAGDMERAFDEVRKADD